MQALLALGCCSDLSGLQRLPVARHPSDREALALFDEKREALRAERKAAGRDVLLRAAMNHFGLSQKVVLPSGTVRHGTVKVVDRRTKT